MMIDRNRSFRRVGYFFKSASLLSLLLLVQVVTEAAPPGSVARAMFTTAIEDREPVNQVLVLDDSVDEVYFFTDLRNLQGQTVRHRWEYDGRVVAEKKFKVKGKRWRVYSSMTLLASRRGSWTVVVLDDEGWPLHAEIFKNIGVDEDDQGPVILPLQ